MSKKRIYFRHTENRAVAVCNDEQFVAMFESNGFERCTNEEYFKARWLTWNDTAVLEVEGDERQRKKVKP